LRVIRAHQKPSRELFVLTSFAKSAVARSTSEGELDLTISSWKTQTERQQAPLLTVNITQAVFDLALLFAASC